VLKSPTLEKIWSNNVFISVGNPRVTSWFCKDELDPNFNTPFRGEGSDGVCGWKWFSDRDLR